MRDDVSRRHAHVFLSEGHERSERNVWAVIALTSAMMLAEIIGGAMFGSIALIADGFHMSTHAGALLLAALAYAFARRRAGDPSFTFGTGKFGDLAGYSSALILAMISLGIAYESAARFFSPTAIDFAEAIPIAALGLVVNVASAWLLSRGGHDHHRHSHGHRHGYDDSHDHLHHDEAKRITIAGAPLELSIFETNAPPRFRLKALDGRRLAGASAEVETLRADGSRQRFAMRDRGAYLESADEIPEPHAFEVVVRLAGEAAQCRFAEPAHAAGSIGRDNNMRAALAHVMADAAVSVLVIVGLTLAKMFGWLWMDPLAGLVGALVIASWAYNLIGDAARVLLDMNPDRELTRALREMLERDGDELVDLHLWRLGPGHLGAILSVETDSQRDVEDYRAAAQALAKFSHLTIEIARRGPKEGERRRVA